MKSEAGVSPMQMIFIERRTCTAHILGTVFYLNNAGVCDACQTPHNVKNPTYCFIFKERALHPLAADEFR